MAKSSRVFIPPLPSSRPLAAPLDKENVANVPPPLATGGSSSTSGAPTKKAESISAAVAADESNVLVKRGSTSGGGSGDGETSVGFSRGQQHQSSLANNPTATPARSVRRSSKPVTTPMTVGGKGGKSRVVRYGETVDSLFCLTDNTTELHRKLCGEIASGDLADDAKSWRAALVVATAHASAAAAGASPSVGRNLIRLHRRATSRFPIQLGSDSSSDDGGSGGSRSTDDLAAIWLLYARAQETHGAREDARQTYRHVLASFKRYGEDGAPLYLAMAEFEVGGCGAGEEGREEGVKSAIEVIEMGIERGAEPKRDLEERLGQLKRMLRGNDDASENNEAPARYDKGGEAAVMGNGDAVQPVVKSMSLPKIPPLPIRSNALPPTREEPSSTRSSQTSQTGTTGGDMSLDTEVSATQSDDETEDIVVFNRKKSAHSGLGTAHVANVTDENDATMPIDDTKGRDTGGDNDGDDDDTIAIPAELKVPPRPSAALLASGATDPKPSTMEKKTKAESSSNTAKHHHVAFAPDTKGDDGETTLDRMKRNVAISSIGQAPSSRLSKATALGSKERMSSLLLGRKTLMSRKRLGGGAMRVSSVEMGNSMSSSDEEEDGGVVSFSDTKKRKKEQDSSDDILNKKLVPKISKTDLSYMLNWDPFASREGKSSDKESEDSKPAALAKEPAMEKIEEESPTEGQSSVGTNSTCSTKSSHRSVCDNTNHTSRTADSHGSGSSERSQRQQHVTPVPDKDPTTPNSASSLSPEQMAMVAKANMDFLPLVCEENIIQVNNTPYAKLGVIGKGGSCKVYRGLSRECSVLAIKKVKLAGMDKKAISSYANEIALLKRLSGNPAIIQLFDSEVDLQRKAIFLVMELGEVDLNHVLQQQALQDGEKKGRSVRNMNFIRLTWQQMLSAVHSIHEERIIHGDLKPANFLFVRGTLKLIDFGIAKAIQSDDTTNIYRDSQIGTLNYMSPESILDTGSGANGARMKCGKGSDVWALGCILYQMCYGRTPFAELHIIQKLQAIVNPNHKISYPDTVDEAAIDAIQQSLRRKPEERPPIVGEGGLLNEHWFLHSSRRR